MKTTTTTTEKTKRERITLAQANAMSTDAFAQRIKDKNREKAKRWREKNQHKLAAQAAQKTIHRWFARFVPAYKRLLREAKLRELREVGM